MVIQNPGHMNQPLFQGIHVYLAAPDADKDPQVEARWTHDPDSQHLVLIEPPRPLSPVQVKKKYIAAAKESKNNFIFSIRLREDDRLIGFTSLDWILWTHGCARFSIQIGDPSDRGHGYGSEALELILRYAFDELNLYRLTANLFEYNLVGMEFLKKAGFQEEVRQRQAIYRMGRRWDLILLGMVREDWELLKQAGGQVA
jgi:RimJ/RimL family protein N-acetyltransferase